MEFGELMSSEHRIVVELNGLASVLRADDPDRGHCIDTTTKVLEQLRRLADRIWPLGPGKRKFDHLRKLLEFAKADLDDTGSNRPH